MSHIGLSTEEISAFLRTSARRQEGKYGKNKLLPFLQNLSAVIATAQKIWSYCWRNSAEICSYSWRDFGYCPV
jgi:hypothetical protein